MGKMIRSIGLFIGIVTLMSALMLPDIKMDPDIGAVKMIQFEDDDYYAVNEKSCLQFLNEHYFNTHKISEKDFLSSEATDNNRTRSKILYLLYCVRESKKEEFDTYLETMIHTDLETAANELNMIKVLLTAYQKWGETKYKELVFEMEGQVYKIFKLEGQTKLYQIDLNTLNSLKTLKKEWMSAYKESRRIINRGYLGDYFPFYEEIYNHEGNTYSLEDEIMMERSLLTVLSLAEEGMCKEKTIKWLKSALKSDGIYTVYNKETGIPVSNIESPSIYAIIGQIGKVLNDRELHTLSVEHLVKFQVMNGSSDTKGAFMSKDAEKADLYANVQALLAF